MYVLTNDFISAIHNLSCFLPNYWNTINCYWYNSSQFQISYVIRLYLFVLLIWNFLTTLITKTCCTYLQQLLIITDKNTSVENQMNYCRVYWINWATVILYYYSQYIYSRWSISRIITMINEYRRKIL